MKKQSRKQFDAMCRKADQLWEKPKDWESADPNLLALCVILQSLRFADAPSYDEDLYTRTCCLLRVLSHRVGVEQRMALLMSVVQEVERRPGSATALMPFLEGDTELSIVSTAALSLAVLLGPVNGDVLHGPRMLRGIADGLPDESAKLGIFTGLLVLGDRRILPLLDRSWELLSPEGRRVLALARAPSVYASVVEFLLGWLEQSRDPGDIGAICGTLARYPLSQPFPYGVVDARRKFPVWAEDSRPPIEVLRSWSFEEFGRLIEPRLRTLAAFEEEPRVLPRVLLAWGLDPKAAGAVPAKRPAEVWT